MTIGPRHLTGIIVTGEGRRRLRRMGFFGTDITTSIGSTMMIGLGISIDTAILIGDRRRVVQGSTGLQTKC